MDLNERQFTRPLEFGWSDYKSTAIRVYKEVLNDNIQVVSAGVAFYFFLSLFPGIAALVSIYGLVVPNQEIQQQIALLSSIFPPQAHEIIRDIAAKITSEPQKNLGWSALFTILFSVWSTKKGISALFTGINIAYDQPERRGIVRLQLTTLLFTVGTILVGVICLALLVIIPAFIDYFPLDKQVAQILVYVRWPVLALIVFGNLCTFYKVAANRSNPKFNWVSMGAAIATVLWLASSLLFSWYAQEFDSFNKSYGSFAAVIVLLLWLFITAFIILAGAEINSELEHQTALDSTVGEDKPLGQRGAYHADHVAGLEDEKSEDNGKSPLGDG